VHKKTADLPGGLSGKPLQVLQPLAENPFIIFILSDLSIDNLRPKPSLRMAEARMRPNNREQAFFCPFANIARLNKTECRDLLEIDLQKASYLLKKLIKKGLLKRVGEHRWTRYQLP
jgi:hypothetical protein